MADRRTLIHDFYRQSGPQRLEVLRKAAAAVDRYPFKGDAIDYTVLVRTDLNGYSSWARERDIATRVKLLDDFFSAVVPRVEAHGGVFYRDEGDCIVALFSGYFATGANFEKAELFCMWAASQTYGSPKLGAKCAVACGDVAYFQKAHEAGTADWSAEGEPFVRSARLEHALPSGPQVAFFKEDYDAHFVTTNMAAPGGSGGWNVNREKLQVPGLSLTGGWTDVVRLTKKTP